jgi:hypothetical protein
MPSRILILEVDDDKYDGLVVALVKRPHIRVIGMDREGRKAHSDCPCCKRKLSKESTFTINDHMVSSLISVAQKMAIAKTVILVNKENPISALPSVEADRCVEVDPITIFRAMALGLLRQFTDGSRATHFVSAAGLLFLSGEKPAAPCSVTTLDGDVLDTSGEILIDGVKFKDPAKGRETCRLASRVTADIPDSVMNFVINGQMSLI